MAETIVVKERRLVKVVPEEYMRERLEDENVQE